MKYAIIENGTVVNIAVSDGPVADNWIKAGTAKIGDLWDGQSFKAPERTPEELAEQQMAERQAMTVDRWSFAGAAMAAGVITAEEAQAWGPGNALPASVEAALSDAISDPAALAMAKVRALAAPRVNRLNPLVEALRVRLNLTPEQTDDLFTAAKMLEAE